MITNIAAPAPATLARRSNHPPPGALSPRDGRLTGLAYLGLAVTGVVGFLLIRQQIYVPDDATATLANLTAQTPLARWGVILDLAIVAFQALSAVAFLRLFHPVDRVGAQALAAFGMVNAVVILGATVCSATALEVALGGGTAATVGLLYQLSDTAWVLGSLFFGLWLMPMGTLARRAGMPRGLGATLIGAGIGYVASTIVLVLAPEASLLADVLAGPATVAEFWMIGYLLLRGAPTLVPTPPRAATQP